MAAKKNENGGTYVTWANFLTVLGIAATTIIALNTFVWTMHGREQTQFEKRVMERFDMQGKRLDKIDKKLEKQ